MGEADRSGRDDERDTPVALPEHSLLELSEYLAMQRAIGNEHRFRILTVLVDEGPLSATGLEAALDVGANTLHYHLNQLVDVGLVENRKRKEPTSDGLYSYYETTGLGAGILEHGVRELIREEWDALDAYGG
jgi:DNA-binding transcriptional ArsR family regulator